MHLSSRLGWVFAALLSLSCNSFAQPAPSEDVERALAQIRPEAIRAHMDFLADDLLEGRGTGSRGYDIAARYVATQLAAAGLQPAGAAGDKGTWFQPIPFRKAVAVEDQSSLVLAQGGKTRTLQYGKDYVLRVEGIQNERSEVTAPVVFVGFGATAPEMKYDDYAGIDVRGKIVAVLTGAPPAFPHNQRAYYSSSRLKGENAVAHGAVGVLLISTPENEASFPWRQILRGTRAGGMRWYDPAGKLDEVFPEIRGIAWLSREGATALFAGAPKTLEQAFADADASRPQSFEMPVRASVTSVARHTKAESANVAGVLRGSDPALRDQYVLYTAHLDHLGITEPVDGDTINNGFYDNASGIGVMLEVARAFASLPRAPRRSILFVAVTGEEKGLRGSEYFARHPTVPIDRIVADVNLDMFLMITPLTDVVAFGAEHSSLGPVAEMAARQVGLTVSPDPAPEETIFIRSDQYSLVRRGVPSLFITHGFKSAAPGVDGGAKIKEWLHTRYHTPQDDASQPLDLDYGGKFARMNFLIAYQVAQDDKVPTWNAGDFFGQRFGRGR